MTTERIIEDDGRVVERRVLADHKRELQVGRIVSLAPVVTVDVNGREFELHKRLASIDVSSVAVGDLLLCCRVTAGLIAVGEVV